MAKIPFGSTLTAKVRWFGDQRLAELQQRAGRGVVKATEIYAKALQAILKKNVGSKPFSGFGNTFVSSRIAGRGKNVINAGNLRVRMKHSPPGSVPFAQTFNLANSIRTSYNFKRRVAFTSKSRTFKIRSRISSDVPYSKTLERGGTLSIPQSRKKYTSIRLINPLKGGVTITPRPAWLPLFERLHPKMVGVIAKELRKGGNSSASLDGNLKVT